jgi:predicted tellurium resistance membrane protein TerC
VIAIAGAAQSSGEHQFLLIVLGLLISIPIIVWGSQLVIKLMERYPSIIVAGGMLLGWIAGGMLVTDPLFVVPDQWTWAPKLLEYNAETKMAVFNSSMPIYWIAHIGGALLVLAIGKMAASKKGKAEHA